jgi:ribosomal peptide maturation radical SAM protein 1
MAFRSKSAPRALSELEELVREHPGCDIQVVDNILDMAYFKDFLPMLAERNLGVELFYETKSNLKKEQIRMLRKAGVSKIQPGVESLSDSVLKLMRKGVTGMQNIQLLKWCKELGVYPLWNIIFGFPGEDPTEYSRCAGIAPLLSHLPAPVGFSDLRLDRFSPNFFDAEKLGFKSVRPLPSYAHVYPELSEEARGNLAYFFSFEYIEPRDVSGYVRDLVTELRSWTKAAKRGDSDLFMVDTGGRLLIWDFRPVSTAPLTVLDGLDRALMLACDAAADVRSIAASAKAAGFESTSESEIAERLAHLVSSRLILAEGPRYLALGILLEEYVPQQPVLERFHRTILRIGEPVRGRRGGRRPPKTLHPSDFVFDVMGDLVVRGAFRIPLVSRREVSRKHGEEQFRT